ncbi:MAG: YccF domain-containing protein [Aquihabitans sp.]
MKTIGNILWLVLGGFWLALGWLFWAALLAITIIGIPFAVQCLKLAQFSLWPFGREARPDPNASSLGIVGAVLWFIPGLLMCLSYICSGIILCITLIGIPFGIQSFKLAGLALAPFGKKIVKTSAVR